MKYNFIHLEKSAMSASEKDKIRNWIFNLKSKDVEPVSYNEIHFVGAQMKPTPKLKFDLNIGDEVLYGTFPPQYQKTRTGDELFDSNFYEIPLAKLPTIKAFGTITKITSRTIWIRIGGVRSKDLEHGQIVKAKYIEVGRLVNPVPDFD